MFTWFFLSFINTIIRMKICINIKGSKMNLSH
jgi:hypothetical protein